MDKKICCHACRKVKDYDNDFIPTNHRICRDCVLERQRKWYIAHRYTKSHNHQSGLPNKAADQYNSAMTQSDSTFVKILKGIDPKSRMYPKTIVFNGRLTLWWEEFEWTGTIHDSTITITDQNKFQTNYTIEELITALKIQ